MMDYQLDKKIVVLGAAKAFPVEDLPGAVLDNGRLSHLMAQVRDNLLRGPHPVNIEISDPEFPYERVGIRSRHILDQYFGVADLAVIASQKLLAGRQDTENIRLIVVATITADKIVPCVAAHLQDVLKLPNALQAFDVRIGCSGYVGTLELVARMLHSYPPGSQALVVGVECMSRVMDASERGTCIIFGDGGGALLVGLDSENEDLLSANYSNPWRIVSAETYTDGSKGDLIEIKSEGQQDRIIYRFVAHEGQVTAEPDLLGKMVVHMDGRSVYKDMLRLVPRKVTEHLQALQWDVEGVDLFLFHQANARMLEAICNRLNIPEEKTYHNIEYYGNTTNGCIPSLMADVLKANNPNWKRAMLVAFGTGYSLSMVTLTRVGG